MRLREILFSVTLPFVGWLLLGAPSLALHGNLALFAIFVLHLFAVIWIDVLFGIFGGDRFTYGSVALGLNGMSIITTFGTTWVTLHLRGKAIERMTDIPPYSWGLIAVGLLATFALPILTHRNVERLPAYRDRREFEDPRKNVG